MLRVLMPMQVVRGGQAVRAAVAGGVAIMISAAATRVAAQQTVTAFVDVAVIPMDKERVLPGQTVVVRGDRIMAVGPRARVRVPAGAVRVDGRGKFLIPGLADMHAHVPGMILLMRGITEGTMSPEGVADAERRLLLYAAYGVTTVRVLYGWRDDGLLRLRARAAAGELLSPRIYAAGGPPGDFGYARAPDSVPAFVAAAKAAGYDFLKLHGESGPVFDSAVAAAHRVGLPIVGHVPGRPDAAGVPGYLQALRAGYTSIEHLAGLEEDTTLDEAGLRARAVATQRAGVWHCPTELLLEHHTDLASWSKRWRTWPERRFVADSILSALSAVVGSGTAPAGGRPGTLAVVPEVAAQYRIIRALHAAGVGLLLGTDAGVPGFLPGPSAHRELEALVRAGLTPYEALATGTRNVAAYLGTLDSTGTVAVGKRADLVLINGNPLVQIAHTSEISGVMLGGRWLPREELDRRLAPLEGTLW